MNYQEFRKALFPEGRASALALSEIRERVGKPDRQFPFQRPDSAEPMIQIYYSVDEGTVSILGQEVLVNDEQVLADMHVVLHPATT